MIRACRIRITVLLLSFLAAVLPVADDSRAAVPAEDPWTALGAMRTARREAVRDRNLAADKADAPGTFGLLVIPVDFADARVADDWSSSELSARLVPTAGETLRNYFRIASGGRLDLRITLAPLVNLPDDRRQYSDRDLNGFTRTRRLATEALTAVRDLGLEFRRLDTDGPDGVPGTGDDDGAVDGVLILHAGVGNENDPEAGLIQALQFYLEEPVTSQGITASFYAVASLQSGPGIWAHETAHLIGMEDRYDPLLHPTGASEVLSAGGLGRFSLMGSGAWGVGGGYGAALPDAYSAAQLGWCRVRNLTSSGATPDSVRSLVGGGDALRVWRRGQTGPEFFLLETRDPALAAPFDAAVPAGQLLITHIDETVPEASWHEDGPYQWHLRARLVEADGDNALAMGNDDGRPEDLFPGPLGVRNFGPSTIPASGSYADGPSGIALTDITTTASGVSFSVSLDTGPAADYSLAFVPDSTLRQLVFSAHETGLPLADLTCELQAVSTPALGVFVGSGATAITFDLQETAPGVWQPTGPVTWQPDTDVPAEARTEFRCRLTSGGLTVHQESRWWVWEGAGAALDFGGVWPGGWTIDYPTFNTGTTWHRWDTSPWTTVGPGPVLACTGADYVDGSAWPAVLYSNSGHTTLTSAPLGGGVTGVRLTHAIEVEVLAGTTGMDGGIVVWVGPDGREVAATPIAGYGGEVAGRSFSALHGQAAFVSPELEFTGDTPRWRTDSFVVPGDSPGPWRLRLVFAANSLWRARGWFIAAIDPLTASDPASDPASGFVASFADDLVWTWPWSDGTPTDFRLEHRPEDSAAWLAGNDYSLVEAAPGRYRLPGATVLAELEAGPRQRQQVRIVGYRPAGEVAGQPVVVYRDGGDGQALVFSAPWPNPATGSVRFLLDVPEGGVGRLRIFDVRGRCVRRLDFASGQQLAAWDGRDQDGARVAAGVYFLRLEGSGPVLTRKVVLLH